ncbi:CBS domain-containing protein [Glycomyces sp. TRM65418]|uniref:CBS domain-containing protein n=1 Tax=Glycomyces sp. TRM65418 TaxID=2867006 RepID=UPI001CE6ADCD|nr:CBS domain-containing protein [Glycomyces sp. TRM65418]MCC3762050.1 CBS domain-containing protein [Glycomyces sp. TRM65418]QZD56121.1 CBS domain-containing protein [Glycomyces sp. TRM65418]
MATARDLMHPGVTCVQSNDTAGNAARLMAELDVGALPICGAEDNKIKGMVTDRDLVLEVMATGQDPETFTVDRLPQGHLILADANEDAENVIAKMKEHQINRVPVIDEGRLVGIISIRDVSLRMPQSVTGDVVDSIKS